MAGGGKDGGGGIWREGGRAMVSSAKFEGGVRIDEDIVVDFKMAVGCWVSFKGDGGGAETSGGGGEERPSIQDTGSVFLGGGASLC